MHFDNTKLKTDLRNENRNKIHADEGNNWRDDNYRKFRDTEKSF